MKILYKIFFIIMTMAFLVACSEDADFSSDINHRLTFSNDTISFDTLFTRVSSSTGRAMVYNRNGKDLRIISVELKSGGSSGFKVMVDGCYGTYVRDLELRSNDSLYVFAEADLPKNGGAQPLQVTDVLCFTLESGLQLNIVLSAYGRDVDFMRGVTVSSDSTIAAGHYVVYDSLVVAPDVTLTLDAGANLYFHNKASMVVRGTLSATGTKDAPIVMRGDRTDRMFSYLPYDRIPGQWGGLVFASTSNGNVLNYCDIHSADFGIKMEAGDSTVQRLVMNASRLENFYGNALELVQAHADVTNSLIANAGGNCVKIVGGNVSFIHCTIANFFVFEQRDVALALHNSYGTTAAPLYTADFINCVITGSKDDELMGYLSTLGDTVPNCKNYRFENSLVNTVIDGDGNFINVISDRNGTSPFAAEHFSTINDDIFYYDFHLAAVSPACSLGGEAFLDSDILASDKDGVVRTAGTVSAGCYQYVAQP